MRLYRTPSGEWVTANGKGHTFYEIPTNKVGLLGWLNQNCRRFRDISEDQQVEHSLDDLQRAELRAVAEASASTTMSAHGQRDWEAADVEAFILERATTAQAERIFATLGTRFKELAHGKG